MPNLFSMVTLKESNNYTIEALKSFFKYTFLKNDDDFYLIDNDKSENNQFLNYKTIKIINNSKPMSFAENVNQSIEIAIKNKKDLVFLNNDIVFTKNWFKPFILESESISIPCNNQIFQYESDLGILKLKPTMNLNNFNNNYELLEEILEQHKLKIKSGQKFQTLLMPFYAFKIPYEILKNVGYFDISYGTGGGEDIDYRFRCAIKGYNVNYLTDSYLLHFHGKSTWGIESEEEIRKRNIKYKEIFKKKWGNEATKIFIERENFLEILQNKNLINLYKKNNFTELIKILIS
jgi:GT2 family glycosyltransferase|tara:strand:- start:3293 stop:4165 length:873 start_codon:yes stop_codon:yes gene_type:complete